MPPLRKPTPSYVLHKQSGRARVVWYDATGVRQQKLLPGPFGSSESRTAFARLQLELEASPAPAVPDREKLTIVELMLAYLDHAERHYRTPAGKPTSELFEVKVVIRVLRELYADTPVSEFGPLALKAARQKWVNEGRSRTECNRRVGMVKRIFKWAASEELAPPAVYHALATVTGLQKGRTVAPETKPVGPVDDAVVDATLLVAAARGLLGGGRRWGRSALAATTEPVLQSRVQFGPQFGVLGAHLPQFGEQLAHQRLKRGHVVGQRRIGRASGCGGVRATFNTARPVR